MKFKVPPVKAEDEIEVEIVGKGKQGDGVAKHEDFIIFVPGTEVGDKLKVKITKVLPNFAFGESVGKAAKAAPAEAPLEAPEAPLEAPEAPLEAAPAEKVKEKKAKKPAKKVVKKKAKSK